MKLASFVTFASLAASAFAQGILIAYPTAGTVVKAGSNITVQVDKPVRILPYMSYSLKWNGYPIGLH